MTGTFISVLPPLVAMLLVILTKRVILSLGLGALTAAILIGGYQPLDTLQIFFSSFIALFITDEVLNTWNIFILLFLLILGSITAFISLSGGSRAFGEWAMKRVKTRVGAQLLTVVLGMLLFIDDYFNALTVGQVSRPVTDRQKVSRVKLAYLIDSTSAPLCVISPISSWGASIIALIGSILVSHKITDYSAFSAFMQIIPLNFYVWAAIIMVFIIVVGQIDFGPMKKHEKQAIEQGILFDKKKQLKDEVQEELPISTKGTVGHLVWPIIVLFIGTVSMMAWTGINGAEGNVSLVSLLENTDVALSLIVGGLLSLAVAYVQFAQVLKKDDKLTSNFYLKATWVGMKSMFGSVLILIFAWLLGDLISQIGTGEYLASVINQSNLSHDFIPVILFIIAALMAFSTGTSWGSFGILLPIAGDIAVATDISLLIPAMAAVLGGAVFGDHASPISDTSILSATGAGSNLIDHVITQFPYAFTAAVAAAISYIILGVSGSVIIALAALIVMMAGILLVVKMFGTKTEKMI